MAVFREVRRVLRKDGVCFLNIADSWNGSGGSGGDYNVGGLKEGQPKNKGATRVRSLKPKNMCLIPQRLAIALQDDGWYFRQQLIWEKNGMPESVTDRFTKSHEYIFLLSKSKNYFFDHVAVMEPANYDGRKDTMMKGSQKYKNGYAPTGTNLQTAALKGHERWNTVNGVPMRNRRSVFKINNEPLKIAHFATFPQELAAVCIKAGSSEHGCCGGCGSPYRRMIEKGLTAHDGETETAYSQDMTAGRLAKLRQAARERGGEYANEIKTIGWERTCKCDTSEIVPSVILDPFMGSGTTALVARKLGRNFVGVELYQKNINIAGERLKELGLFV